MKSEDAVANGRSPANGAGMLALPLAATTGLAIPASDWHQLRGLNGSDFNATPALVGRQLFPRSNRTLYCIEPMQTAGAGKTQ